MPHGKPTQELRDTIQLAAKDDSLIRLRTELAHFTAETFSCLGQEIHLLGHLIGPDPADGPSPFGH